MPPVLLRAISVPDVPSLTPVGTGEDPGAHRGQRHSPELLLPMDLRRVEVEGVAMSQSGEHALDALGRFIEVSRDLSDSAFLASPDGQAAAKALQEIAGKLLAANENMAKAVSAFAYFDFMDEGARKAFLAATKAYRDSKTGGRLRRMKYRCGEIWDAYVDHVEPQLHNFSNADDVRLSFERLGNSDEDMVAFIYSNVVNTIDSFVDDVEPLVERSDMNAAERRRLQMRRDVAPLMARLAEFGGELVDLEMKYARAAHRRASSDR
jgi:hypothetical protein